MPRKVSLSELSGCNFEAKKGGSNMPPEEPEEMPYVTPREVTAVLRNGGITGQDAAVRAASLITFNHFEDRPSVSLFAGPTGSGKTEIWRVLQREFGDIICIQDASTLTAEGWKGGNKISTIFRAIAPDIRGRVILVLDEADKMIEPQYGNGGTNYADMMQNQLLRLCDRDTLFFGSADGGQPLSIDCSGVSVVLLGAFERLLQRKGQQSGSIGFGATLRQKYSYGNADITTEDLIEYGMRAELAGRINRIICMEPLTVADMVLIGRKELERLSYVMHSNVIISNDRLAEMAGYAIDKGLGARWLKSQLMRKLDDLMYDDPAADCYSIGVGAYTDDELGCLDML